ncbi:hypothetical protein CLAFUW4_11482 [Fulvia fulva]|nr:hypothetical protein CLAFUR4_11488 [Fulvia fulva]KAK4621169.1 hypothetical protein CLAFUR0_11496 [Fulvia fulva]WPV17074.1 hypothetical protein CLAFUW4_11482 [Fulvia fulva]WPV32321.1 hypothetical protein CLAFUW7_11487 [Fulvia fulva]
MATPRSPPGSIRRHGRNISHPIPRRTTVGPLEEAADDPLAEATPAPPVASKESEDALVPPVEQLRDSTPQPPNVKAPQQKRPALNLGFLQNGDLYHQLFVNDVPKAFLESPSQPSLEASLSELLQGGHFRRAAEKALRDLLAHHGSDSLLILHLLYTRLACLVLISRPDLAAQEALPLLDMMARNPPGVQVIVQIMPWELRLLLVRLQSIGAADGGRRGIMALYALSAEARANLRDARTNGDNDNTAIWTNRLQDLGLRVCDALVEMGELETATRHLDTLADIDPDNLAYRKALLKVRVGDVSGARRCAEQMHDAGRKKGLEALFEVADGNYSSAIRGWQMLTEEHAGHESFTQNAAVSLLYTGRITSAQDVLEDLSARLPMFPTLLFNLSTVYELCTERAIDRKTALVQRAAEQEPGPDSGGWERSTFEFKL